MKIKVGVLGATGMVGQRFIQLLENHPWFELSELAASKNSAGKSYEEAVKGKWKLLTEIPEEFKNLKVKECTPGLDCDLVFSALDSDIAEAVEQDFAKNNYGVSSNSKNHRMAENVPLLIPEVNADHLQLIKKQDFSDKGFIVTNPNCSTAILCLALAPLQKKFGLSKLNVVTLQALSGAGYPGVASMDILDNVIPFIGEEEEKINRESKKIFGSLNESKIDSAEFNLSASCNRVNTSDGHLECINLELKEKIEKEELIAELKKFNPLKELNLPSSPSKPIVVFENDSRPQVKFDRDAGKGMSVSVGRIREDYLLDYKMIVLGHNTIRGAAGAAILNAELMKAKKLL